MNRAFRPVPEAATITIGALSEKLGITPRTIRYYESIGLIPPAIRGANGYRHYRPGDEHRLAFIQRAKALGLTLEEIRELVLVAEDGSCALTKAELRQTLERKIADCTERIKALVAFRATLEAVVYTLSAAPSAEADACCPSCASFAPSCACVPTPLQPALDIAVTGKD